MCAAEFRTNTSNRSVSDLHRAELSDALEIWGVSGVLLSVSTFAKDKVLKEHSYFA